MPRKAFVPRPRCSGSDCELAWRQRINPAIGDVQDSNDNCRRDDRRDPTPPEAAPHYSKVLGGVPVGTQPHHPRTRRAARSSAPDPNNARVSSTEAGERLLRNIGSRLDEIETEVDAVREFRDKPAGTIRITATEFAIDAFLVPRLAPLLKEYPDIRLEMIVDYGLTDIVAQQYDAGVRSGEQVAKDMIAVRIGPDMRMAVVGAPSYFKSVPSPDGRRS